MERGTIYPSWRYHPSGQSRLIHHAAEDDALTPDWSDRDVRFTAVPVSAPVVSDTPDEPVEQVKKRGPGRPRKAE